MRSGPAREPRRAAMLLVVTTGYELLLHHRDDIPGIAHPGCWAGFGGAVEEGETAVQAVRREMLEETGVEIEEPTFLTEVVDEEGDGRLVSLFYLVGGIAVTDIDLHEGVGVGLFRVEDLDELRVTPFVRRAISSHLVPALVGRSQ